MCDLEEQLSKCAARIRDQWIRGYIYVMATLNFIYFLMKGIRFFKNNRGTYLRISD
jgi:hypothetical protein